MGFTPQRNVRGSSHRFPSTKCGFAIDVLVRSLEDGQITAPAGLCVCVCVLHIATVLSTVVALGSRVLWLLAENTICRAWHGWMSVLRDLQTEFSACEELMFDLSML